jgi:hypothetical protein
MPRLYIDFQDGFVGDTIEITLDNQPVARYENVRTDLRINLAQRFETELPPGEHTVQIQIPQRAPVVGFPLNLERDTYVGVSLQDEAIVYSVQDEPFVYM